MSIDGGGVRSVFFRFVSSVGHAAAPIFGVEAAFDGIDAQIGRALAAICLIFAAVFSSYAALDWGRLGGENVGLLLFEPLVFAIGSV